MAHEIAPPTSQSAPEHISVEDSTAMSIPLSFPAILRNPGISSRYAYLHTSRPSTLTLPTGTKKNKRGENEGKRWVRRKENARFLGNPHIVLATKKDYTLQLPPIRATFPEPLPPYLSRNASVPTTTLPTYDPNSANAGRFSLGLKGMRRELRKSGFRAELLVRDIEYEIIGWLQGGIVLSPDLNDASTLHFPGAPIGSTEAISEVSRTPLQLVWSITDDAFARYVVHCCARYHEIVSFSKEVSGQRLTYLLRPNVTRPNAHATSNLDTPPATDIDYSSQIETESDIVESDIVSDHDSRSETGHFPDSITGLHVISENSTPSSLRASSPALDSIDGDSWSVIGDTDAEGDQSESELGLAASVDSLSLEAVPDCTLRSESRISPSSARPRIWDYRQGRSTSSPSRSPARRPRRAVLRVNPPRSKKDIRRSFYDYLFT